MPACRNPPLFVSCDSRASSKLDLTPYLRPHMAHMVMARRAGNHGSDTNSVGSPKGTAMKISFRITRELLARIHADLSRPHPFAAERVAFISCGVAAVLNNGLMLLAEAHHPVSDDNYIDNPRAGATIGSAAFRTALQLAYNQRISMFHVHRHEHRGMPHFSSIDLRESARFMPDFWKVRPDHPHGVLVLSHDSMAGLCWYPGQKTPIPVESFSLVGQPTSTIRVTV